MTANDWAKIIEAGASAIVLVLGAVGLLYAKMHSVGASVNGRMTELLDLTRSAARAQGTLDALPPNPGAAAPEAAGMSPPLPE